MFGPNSLPDIASVAAWDGMRLITDAITTLGRMRRAKYIDFMKGRKMKSRAAKSRSTPRARHHPEHCIRRV
jgi:hypothetical protein